jgi:hypothetical protein
MPTVTVDQPLTTSQTPSGTGSWLIPIFLVALLVGVVLVVYLKPSLKNAILRILLVHCKVGLLSRFKRAQSYPTGMISEVESKRGFDPYLESVFVRPAGFNDSVSVSSTSAY